MGLIVLATIIAYSNTLRCPFVFDDIHDIVENSSIRHLWPLRDVFTVHYGGRTGLHSRPVVNFSLAVNYAAASLDPFPYHVTNLLIHVLAGLALFGIVRRTLLLPSLGGRFAAAATSLALAVALIWTLHPLQTGAVTYVTQRYESMMGLFYLLALYAAVRCGTSAHPRRWAVATVGATLLALGCKEVAVSIPITVLLYDRAFLAGSFREAWRRRWGMYLGLAAAWALFAALFLCSSGRSQWAGYGLPVTWIEYARTQFGVILHYLRLVFWPSPLVLDYHWSVAHTVGQIVPPALVIGGLVAATGYALIRWPKWGLLGAWFFLILAPTSSVLPILDLAFEHRMYLPLAAVIVGVVIGGWVVGQRLVDSGRISRPASQVAGGTLVLLACAALGILTFQRNADYRTDLSIWQDAVAKQPDNERAHANLGVALADRQRAEEAIVEYQKALELSPDYAEAHNNLGLALVDRQRADEAIVHYHKAMELHPDYAEAHNNLGVALAARGQHDEAAAFYQKALELKPDYAEAHNNLGLALAARGQPEEAISHYQAAVAIKPDFAESHNNLGIALAQRGELGQAIAHFQAALDIKLDRAAAYNRLGALLAGRGQTDEAIVQYRETQEIVPQVADLHYNLGDTLYKLGRVPEAIAQWSELIRLQPDNVPVLNQLARVLATSPEASVRDGARAVDLAQQAMKLTGGGEPAVLGTLAAAYAEAGQFSEAVKTAEQALALATSQNNTALAEALRARIKLHQNNSPYRDTRQPSPPSSGHP
jgi:tetratricopeptide (TPR) repeat protein